MKTTNHFKETIQEYLERRSAGDELFARSYAKPGKNIDDCITCILNTVRESGCNGFTDDEVYSMAVHYYDEENIETGKHLDCRVVVNHTVELTGEEKRQAHEMAMQRVQDEAYARMKQSSRKPQVKQGAGNQLELF
jgi:hypothetical protein